jgi:hypothetical protein
MMAYKGQHAGGGGFDSRRKRLNLQSYDLDGDRFRGD